MRTTVTSGLGWGEVTFESPFSAAQLPQTNTHVQRRTGRCPRGGRIIGYRLVAPEIRADAVPGRGGEVVSETIGMVRPLRSHGEPGRSPGYREGCSVKVLIAGGAGFIGST